ncbi:MAG TPA: ABC transporter permease [Thermoanaerobaculia bacterium]|jgi:predicted permease|nr:ABC transporter permease [Thermoanaerobaculia bacterium]
MLTILSSVRSLFRGFRSSPGFLVVVLFTLAVGIGATAAIFTVVNAVLIRPLPYPEPERLVAVWNRAPGMHLDQFEHSEGSYLVYRRHNHVLEDLGIYGQGSVTLTGGDRPERVEAAGMTASIFSVLRVRPLLGRTFQEADGLPGAEPVTVLSHELWRRRYGGRHDVLGQLLQLDGVATRVVGVMPAGFRFPSVQTKLWQPMTIDPAKPVVGSFSYTAVGRLKPGVTRQRAARELSSLVFRIAEDYGERDVSRGMIASVKLSVLVHSLRDDLVGDVERVLWLLLGSVGIILVIACANVANLFLVRAEGRQREVALRTALGASRRDVARLFLSESITLALMAGALGLGLAALGMRLLVHLGPEGIPRLDEIGIDGYVLAFTAAVSIAAGLVCGGLALLRFGRPEMVPALKEGGRGGSAGRERLWTRAVLVVVQMALALVLLVGSGLMAKSFWRLRGVNPGFSSQGVLTLRLYLPSARYPDAPSTVRFNQQLLEKVRALPGVVGAGTVSILPLSGGNSNSGYTIEDFPLPKDTVPPLLGVRFTSPGYLEAMRIPLIAGHTFDRLDPGHRSGDVVVSQAMAEHFWPGKSALGKRLTNGISKEQHSWYTIVGVVGSVRDIGLDKKPLETVYMPLLGQVLPPGAKNSEFVSRDVALVVRGRGAPASLVALVRQAVWSLDPNLALADVRPMEQVVARSMERTSFTMLLLSIAAAVAVVLGTVGIYGVISYVVSQRTREIGVRMALGAARGDIARMVLREGLFISLAGIVLGLLGAFAVTRLLIALLFDTSPLDPGVFAAVPVLLAAVALLASWLPAERAASVEPLEAIRYE